MSEAKNSALSINAFNAMGKPISLAARQAGYDWVRSLGIDQEQAFEAVSTTANQLEQDHPYEALWAAHKVLDLTGAYRLMAILLTPTPSTPPAATEAAKATGTAGEQTKQSFENLEELRDKWKIVDGDMREGDNGLITHHLTAFMEGLNFARAEAARQPAPVAAVKTWQERAGLITSEEIVVHNKASVAYFMQQEIADLRAALRSCAGAVRAVADAELFDLARAHFGVDLPFDAIKRFSAALAATNRSQP